MDPDDPATRLAHLAAIVEGSDDAIVSKDLKGRILTWNRGAERIFGWTAAEAIGRPMTLIFPPDRLAEEDDILAKVAAGQKVDHYETIRRRKDGSPVHVSVTVSPIRDGTGRIVAASKVARDVTEHKRYEAALRESNERLRRMDEDRRQFLNVVAHELRTPLTPILLQLEYLQEGGLEPERLAHALEMMERNLRRLNGLVHQLVEVARLDGRSIELRRRDADLCALLAEMVEVFRPSAGRAGVGLRLDCPSPLVVRIDPDRIAQVATNLLANALKFTAPGGAVEVRVEPRVETAAGPAVRVTVTDTGAGFTAEQRDRMFQPFSRAHMDHPGTGLGLFISRAIMEMHGGTIDARSAGAGQGAEVAFCLPLEPPAAPAAPPAP